VNRYLDSARHARYDNPQLIFALLPGEFRKNNV